MYILQCSCFPAILLITQYCIAGSRMTLWMMLMIIIINDADDDHHHYDADDDASCCSILHWSALQGPGATGRRGRCCMLPLRNKPPRCNTSSSPSSDHHHNVAWMPGCLDVWNMDAIHPHLLVLIIIIMMIMIINCDESSQCVRMNFQWFFPKDGDPKVSMKIFFQIDDIFLRSIRQQKCQTFADNNS